MQGRDSDALTRARNLLQKDSWLMAYCLYLEETINAGRILRLQDG